jgi:hypothetical protein
MSQPLALLASPPRYPAAAFLLPESGGRLPQEDGVSRLVLEPGGGGVIELRAAVGTYNFRAGPASYNLRAGAASYGLAAAGDAIKQLRAAGQTTFSLKAGPVMSITQNIRFFRGEDVTLNFAMQPPQDVTGWHLTLTVADSLGGTVRVTKTATIDDTGRGTFHFAIANADTASLAVGRYVWDVRRTDSGSKSTVADGYLDLAQEVTT